MGNNSTKEARNSTSSESHQDRGGSRSTHGDAHSQSGAGRSQTGQASRSSRTRRDLPLVGLAVGGLEQRRETKQERDARRAQKERNARLQERERSLREESVDGGYLVTLGTYTGPEDFSKATVRQLMLERRLAPFWRGLNEHSDSWTEYQLVAVARGLPIPAPDEIPQELISPSTSHAQSTSSHPIPIHSTKSKQSSSGIGSASNPTPNTSSPLFRTRSRTLASLSSQNESQTDLASQEVCLPHEPQINGQPIEANLYKDVMECPICFLYYPPHLNRTRCCDQPICSECFVQIKRPDPHAPEHLDPNSPVPEDVRRLEEEGQLVSEPAACPFCVQTEFGITYEPPPFRRGLAYASSVPSRYHSAIATSPTHIEHGTPPIGPRRRRGQSLSALAPGVITTDKVRPDWVKKLSDARSHAARRSAAATALHNAAYMMGGSGDPSRLAFGRRRRNYMLDTPGSSGDGTPGEGISIPNMELLMAALGESGASRNLGGNGYAPSGRYSSRSDGTSELENLLLMEAIRQSMQVEEERKKKEEKEAAKQAKKDEKQRAKEQKKADKAAKKSGLYPSSTNASSFFSASPPSTALANQQAAVASVEEGKGKAKAMAGMSLLHEPTLTLNDDALMSMPTEPSGSRMGEFASGAETGSSPSTDRPQWQSQLQTETNRSIFDPNQPRGGFGSGSPFASSLRQRQLSDASSSGSSLGRASPNSSGLSLGLQAPESSSSNAGADTAFNFGSLAAMIDRGDSPFEQADVARDLNAARSDSPNETQEEVLPAREGSVADGIDKSPHQAGTESSTALEIREGPYDGKHYGHAGPVQGTSQTT